MFVLSHDPQQPLHMPPTNRNADRRKIENKHTSLFGKERKMEEGEAFIPGLTSSLLLASSLLSLVLVSWPLV